MRPETEADDRRHANGINDLNVVFSKEERLGCAMAGLATTAHENWAERLS